jgi:hypothetical protein
LADPSRPVLDGSLQTLNGIGGEDNAHVLEGPQAIHQVQEVAQSRSMKIDVP